MATATDLQRIALSLAGTTEAPHFDRAAFKVARIYATLASDGRTANLKFSHDEQELKCTVAPAAFQAIANAWGKQGWTIIQFHTAYDGAARGAMVLAWEGIGKIQTRSPARKRW